MGEEIEYESIDSVARCTVISPQALSQFALKRYKVLGLVILTTVMVVNLLTVNQVNLPTKQPSQDSYKLNFFPESNETSSIVSMDLKLFPNSPDEMDMHRPANIPQRFLIEEEDFCRRQPNLEIIVYVHSAITRIHQRRDMWQTWANNVTAMKLGVNIAVVYMVGRTKNEEEDKILKSQSETYHDIVQGDYADYYKLLTYKGLAALNWIVRHCSNVPWTIHTDDDILVDIFLLNQALKELEIMSLAEDKFICYVFQMAVSRNGRFGLSVEDWPDKEFPTYCLGLFWILPTRALPKLLNATKSVNFLWIDDAYLTGYLAKEAGIGHMWFDKYAYHLNVPFDKSHIGNSMVWFPQLEERVVHWNEILNHYQNKLNITDLTGR